MNESVGVEERPSARGFPSFVIILVALECHISKQSLSFPISKMGMIKPYMVL